MVHQLLGGILAGWGVVSLVEGLAGRPGPGQLAYDLGFLASGAVLVMIGTLFARRARG